MKFSKEFGIGLMAIIAIGGAIWGYKYLKGQNLLTRSQVFKVQFDEVDMLEVSAPVYVSGYQVGTVAKVSLSSKDMRTIEVMLDIEEPLKFHKDTEANIVSMGIMGQRAIELKVPGPCSGDDCAKSGDYLNGRLVGLVESMVGDEDIEGFLKDISKQVGAIFDSLNARITNVENPEGLAAIIRNLEKITENLAEGTATLNITLDGSSRNLVRTSSNMAELTDGLKGTDEKLQSVLSNVETISGQVKDADLGKTITTANNTLEQSAESLKSLDETLAEAKKAMSELETLLKGINEGKGSLGALANDKEFINRLNDTLEKLSALLNNPEVDVKVGLFGGKKKKKDANE